MDRGDCPAIGDTADSRPAQDRLADGDGLLRIALAIAADRDAGLGACGRATVHFLERATRGGRASRRCATGRIESEVDLGIVAVVNGGSIRPEEPNAEIPGTETLPDDHGDPVLPGGEN